MKKKYEAPAVAGIELDANSLFASSRLDGVSYDKNNPITQEEDLLTRRQGWHSKLWEEDE